MGKPGIGQSIGPRFEDKFRSANQMDGISIAGGGKMAKALAKLANTAFTPKS